MSHPFVPSATREANSYKKNQITFLHPLRGAARKPGNKACLRSPTSLALAILLHLGLILASAAFCSGQNLQGQQGRVRIRQVYLHNHLKLGNYELRVIQRRFALESAYARSVYAQIGISIDPDPAEIVYLPSGSLIAEAQALSWRDSRTWGDIIPIIYADNIKTSGRWSEGGGRGLPENGPGGRGEGKAVVLMDHNASFINMAGASIFAGLFGSVLYPYDTLAHEIGHVLLNNSRFLPALDSHSEPPHSLMCAGSRRALPALFDMVYSAGQNHSVIDFLPMIREEKLLNQVEAMYTSSSYVTAKTPASVAPLSVIMGFVAPAGPDQSKWQVWQGGFQFHNGGLPFLRVLRMGERLDQTILRGEITIYDANNSETTSPPFEMAAYQRQSGRQTVEAAMEYYPMGLTIPEEFTEEQRDGLTIGDFSTYDYVKLQKVDTNGTVHDYPANSSYEIFRDNFTFQLNYVDRRILQNANAVRVLAGRTIASPPAMRADFNGDGALNKTDVLLLYAHMRKASPAHDLNSDGIVSFSDALELASLIPGLALGDLNFDGQVDETDFTALRSGWKTSAGLGGGDIDGDGTVNEADLAIMATRWRGAPTQYGGILLARGEDRMPVPFSQETVPAWEATWTAQAGRTYELETSADCKKWTSVGYSPIGQGDPVVQLLQIATPKAAGFIRLKADAIAGADFSAVPRLAAAKISWNAAKKGEIFGIEVWSGDGTPNQSGNWTPLGAFESVVDGLQSLLLSRSDRPYRIVRAVKSE